jgi:hypothetical protein
MTLPELDDLWRWGCGVGLLLAIAICWRFGILTGDDD